MGTVFSFDVRAPGVDPRGLSAAIDWLHWVDRTFTTYQPDSPISRLGSGELRLDQVGPRVREVLGACADLREATGGYFDAEAGGRLDPSGYVKGWAIAGASTLLGEFGSIRHTVNGGGDVQCAGSAEPGRPWRLGIADPTRPGRLAAVIEGEGIAVATSGIAERGAHIIDPHTGAAVTYWASVTVVGADIALCDAYATAAAAMGPAAPSWLSELPGHRAFCIRPDGTSWATPGFETTA
jgi:thiamine biosynthesis lipoprotein